MSKSDTTDGSEDVSDSGRTVCRAFDPSTVAPSTVVVELLAELEGCDAADVGPLYDTVDSDALDSLIRHRDTSTDCAVTFPYDDFEVTVSSDGEVLVSGPESAF